MLLPHLLNAGKIYGMKITNKCFENVAQFRYLGMTIRNQNLIQEEIKRILNSGNACYRKTIILPVVLYGCETWTLTLREEHRLSVFGNRVLRRI
jgi:hypothetical protein